jgi:hypothetical protein
VCIAASQKINTTPGTRAQDTFFMNRGIIMVHKIIWPILLGSCLFITGSLSEHAFANEASKAIPSLVDAVTTQPINAGFNPAFIGIRLNVKVLQGDNPCLAESHLVKLQVNHMPDTIVVEAVKTKVSGPPCNNEYDPVYRTYMTDLRFDGQHTHKIVVKNYRQFNVDYIISTGN